MDIADLMVGMILHFFDNESHDPKNKFNIIVGASTDLFCFATVYINSEINISRINSSELKALQYEIKQQAYPNILIRDSYIDCSRLTHRLQSSFLSAINSENNPVGTLLIKDQENIIKLLSTSDSLSPHYINLYGIGK